MKTTFLKNCLLVFSALAAYSFTEFYMLVAEIGIGIIMRIPALLPKLLWTNPIRRYFFLITNTFMELGLIQNTQPVLTMKF